MVMMMCVMSPPVLAEPVPLAAGCGSLALPLIVQLSHGNPARLRRPGINNPDRRAASERYNGREIMIRNYRVAFKSLFNTNRSPPPLPPHHRHPSSLLTFLLEHNRERIQSGPYLSGTPSPRARSEKKERIIVLYFI